MNAADWEKLMAEIRQNNQVLIRRQAWTIPVKGKSEVYKIEVKII